MNFTSKQWETKILYPNSNHDDDTQWLISHFPLLPCCDLHCYSSSHLNLLHPTIKNNEGKHGIEGETRRKEDDQPIYEEEGIWAMNKDQALTLSLSSLLHPSVFSCFFSDAWEKWWLNRWRGLGFVGRDGKRQARKWRSCTVLLFTLFFFLQSCNDHSLLSWTPNNTYE